ncbi:hypothetical protein M2139_001613 [Enterococcus sp. PF1-24]|uniref:nuclear transport factor 2 family protein n=1 Tax=unclassified Enterococcus TaxID=2608891 RepID=UPI0024757F16|nr:MULTISPECIES: nuclear transport factor 2 family protein [unclassified Enterococcus]MDH6364626.1 hypothetical protein [Enterococcus sp. PFB1-1]MDH6401727.1 hypothetical protein [Enterococcus sp. PF1-24]
MEAVIKNFWQSVAKQELPALREYFVTTAVIDWPNTNERFTREEYLVANCEYPGAWQAVVLQCNQISVDEYVSITQVRLVDEAISFHAISYYRMIDGKICYLKEFWSEDGEAPEWRKKKNIGKKINS